MGEVSLRGYDQIWDQVVTALELYVDLRKGIFEAVAQRHQAVVDAHHKQGDADGKYEENSENDKCSHSLRRLSVRSGKLRAGHSKINPHYYVPLLCAWSKYAKTGSRLSCPENTCQCA